MGLSRCSFGSAFVVRERYYSVGCDASKEVPSRDLGVLREVLRIGHVRGRQVIRYRTASIPFPSFPSGLPSFTPTLPILFSRSVVLCRPSIARSVPGEVPEAVPDQYDDVGVTSFIEISPITLSLARIIQ